MTQVPLSKLREAFSGAAVSMELAQLEQQHAQKTQEVSGIRSQIQQMENDAKESRKNVTNLGVFAAILGMPQVTTASAVTLVATNPAYQELKSRLDLAVKHEEACFELVNVYKSLARTIQNAQLTDEKLGYVVSEARLNIAGASESYERVKAVLNQFDAAFKSYTEDGTDPMLTLTKNALEDMISSLPSMMADHLRNSFAAYLS